LNVILSEDNQKKTDIEIESSSLKVFSSVDSSNDSTLDQSTNSTKEQQNAEPGLSTDHS
jgi:hypothetical protein